MNINDLTLGQAKELAALFGAQQTGAPSLNGMIGKKVIIRTYSAGVWFGVLSEKSGSEVIVTNARRMWRWWAAESISLSAVALHGVKAEKSKVAEAVPSIWLEAIEIIPCSEKAAAQLEAIENAKAE
jgi:hypothetical protein